MSDGDPHVSKRFAVVSGTGRAGTSFLVKFLMRCGVDAGEAPELEWHDRARAGMERSFSPETSAYLVKDPWLFQYCEDIDLSRIRIDALIVPVRNLADAAKSRVVQERAAIAEGSWRERSALNTNGKVPGGVVYSIDQVDQERILAVGFANLVRWAVRHELPLYLLDFPRMVEDREYLVDALWPWLSKHCDRATALAAFDDVADASLVRSRDSALPSSRDLLNVEAERRALLELVAERDAAREHAMGALRVAMERVDALERELGASRQELLSAELALAEREVEHARLHARVGTVETELDKYMAHAAALQADLDALVHSAAWRMTRPMRIVVKKVREARARLKRGSVQEDA